ncbi:hypothetical protein QFZ42_004146 [Variovorax paradoxus]|nr:hypothetical protein [Variovorax paradoxus]
MSTQTHRPSGDLYEIWMHPNPDVAGDWLPSCVPAGPDGNPVRELSEKIFGRGHCVWVFWADSHEETMNIYYTFQGWGTHRP